MIGVFANALGLMVKEPVTALKSSVVKLAHESNADSPIVKLATSGAINF